MWDFSWIERRWPGAGYESWDKALDELAEPCHGKPDSLLSPRSAGGLWSIRTGRCSIGAGSKSFACSVSGAAARTGRWRALATSNFCGPQFVAIWSDFSLHQRLAAIIRNGAVLVDQVEK